MVELAISKHEIEKICGSLNEKKVMIIPMFRKESGYDEEDIEMLWIDQIRFVENFIDLITSISDIWNKKSVLYQKWEKFSKYERVPWGKVLICSPANAPIPLIIILLVSFVSMRNEVILSPSRRTIKTARLLFNIFKDSIKNKDIISFYDKGCKNAIKEYVETGKVNLLYFQGSSKFRDEIYSIAYSNGVDVIFEGEGNVVAIVDEDCIIEEAVKKLFKAKKFCGGQMCTSPNVIFVHNRILNTFKKLFSDTSVESKPISIMNMERIAWVKSLIDKGKLQGHMRGIYPQNQNYTGIRPTLIEISKLEYIKFYLNIELFSPYVFIVSYDDLNEVFQLLKNYWKYGLQISIFTKNRNLIDKIKREIHVGRITINMNPTYQNSLLPWGGYKLSGFSYVMNFLEKATRPIIIEGNRGDKNEKSRVNNRWI